MKIPNKFNTTTQYHLKCRRRQSKTCWMLRREECLKAVNHLDQRQNWGYSNCLFICCCLNSTIWGNEGQMLHWISKIYWISPRHVRQSPVMLWRQEGSGAWQLASQASRYKYDFVYRFIFLLASEFFRLCIRMCLYCSSLCGNSYTNNAIPCDGISA